MKYQDFAIGILQEHGYRITAARKSVVEILANSTQALNPYEIADLINSGNKSKIDTSTVYRILGVLEEMNLVHFLKEKQRYLACKEWACTQKAHCHHQFVCDSCHEVSEVHVDDSNFFQNLQKEVPNLIIKQHYLELSGLCAKCIN